MDKIKLKELKNDILSCLTDKNVGFVPTKTDEEQFGALMAFGQAFTTINSVFDKYNI